MSSDSENEFRNSYNILLRVEAELNNESVDGSAPSVGDGNVEAGISSRTRRSGPAPDVQLAGAKRKRKPVVPFTIEQSAKRARQSRDAGSRSSLRLRDKFFNNEITNMFNEYEQSNSAEGDFDIFMSEFVLWSKCLANITKHIDSSVHVHPAVWGRRLGRINYKSKKIDGRPNPNFVGSETLNSSANDMRKVLQAKLRNDGDLAIFFILSEVKDGGESLIHANALVARRSMDTHTYFLFEPSLQTEYYLPMKFILDLKSWQRNVKGLPHFDELNILFGKQKTDEGNCFQRVVDWIDQTVAGKVSLNVDISYKYDLENTAVKRQKMKM